MSPSASIAARTNVAAPAGGGIAGADAVTPVVRSEDVDAEGVSLFPALAGDELAAWELLGAVPETRYNRWTFALKRWAEGAVKAIVSSFIPVAGFSIEWLTLLLFSP